MLNTALVIAAYLLGSVSCGVLVSKALGLQDPRNAGSGNPGATNVQRLGGNRAALLTLAGDTAKGLAPVLVARALETEPLVWALCGGAAFLGHLYPVFFRFRGGKGVATALGVLLGLSPLLALALVALWLCVFACSRYSSLAALGAAAGAPLLAWWLSGEAAFIGLCAGLAAFLFLRHRENIRRLLSGAENKISLRRKP